MIFAPDNLRGKTCLITGASSGIGKATAKLVSSCGGTVLITGRNRERLEVTLSELEGSGHLAITADLLESEDMGRLIMKCPEIHGVVHCAGISRVAPIRYTTDKLMQEITATNVNAPVALTRELIKNRRMQLGGSIVFMSSLSAMFGWTGFVAYSSSKAALIGVTRALASELASQEIRCNCLAPGMVKTQMIKSGYTQQQLEEYERKYPFGFGEPMDVANAIVFFLSDASQWITGQTLVMDGGVSLQ